jgi:hypothetical protein
MTQYIVEYLDLVFAQALGIMQEKVSNLSQGADALRRRAASYGLLKFGDDGDLLLQNMPLTSLPVIRGTELWLLERNADPKVCTPDDPAGNLQAVFRHDQREVCRDSRWIIYLQ